MKKKILLVILVIFLTIGYAAVNTNLFIEVYSSFAINENDLSVYFSGAYLDDEDYSNEVISEDKKSIVVSGESLVSNGSMVISYDITNASTSYDAIVNVECVSSIDGVTFVSTDENLLISAREVGVSSTNVSGTITEVPTITCELKVSASGRTEASNASLAEADEYVVYGTLTDSSGNSLANANVVIYSETPHYTTTDEDGYLFYNGIEKGSHEIYYVDDTLENIKSMSKDEVIANAVSKAQFTTRSSGNVVFENNVILKDAGLMAVTPFCESLVGTAWKYEYTGSEQSFLIYCDGNYKVELWGAQGGDTTGDLPQDIYQIHVTGGKGAYTTGDIILENNSKLYLYLGQAGFSETASQVLTFNGGGNNHYGEGYAYASGGGATDIRLVNGEWSNFDSLKSRLMVAAGGGGAGNRGIGYGGSLTAGSGGTLIGGAADSLIHEYNSDGTTFGYAYGMGGTQTAGGKVVNILGTGNSSWLFEDSLFGMAKIWSNSNVVSSGGGGGYYGGAGGRHAGGGGGSSFISGYSGCDAITEASTQDNIIHTGQANHYSGYIFTNSQMIAGNDTMPTHDGTSTMTGNSGNGYAKITFVSYGK